MEIREGGIFIPSCEWMPYKDPIMDKRPIIVIRKHEKYVDTVSMGVIPKSTNVKNCLMLNYNVLGR